MIVKTQIEDIGDIVDLYNNITSRNRTFEQHRWEWFDSPYKNYTYVILNKKKEFLGHHGVLGIELFYKGKTFKVGKTENTIVKKGFGALYFKNEKMMFKEYSLNYDYLISTAVHGVTRKIRHKLGYNDVGLYEVRVKLVKIEGFLKKVNNGFVRGGISFMAPLLNLLFFKRKYSEISCHSEISDVNLSNLKLYSDLYHRVKNSLGLSQVRSLAYLTHRFIDNPYKKSYVFEMFDSETKEHKGSIFFYINAETAYIEDLLFTSDLSIKLLIRIFYNRIKEQDLASMILIRLLKGSFLSKENWVGFYTFKGKNDMLLINKLNKESSFKKEDIYFTPLLNEGIL